MQVIKHISLCQSRELVRVIVNLVYKNQLIKEFFRNKINFHIVSLQTCLLGLIDTLKEYHAC